MRKARAGSFGSVFEQDHSRAGVHHYATGQNIFEEGEVGDAIFRLERGTVKLSLLSSGKKVAGLSLLLPGDCFGEGCLLEGGRRTHTATALNASTIRRVTKTRMLQRLRQEAPLARQFVTYLLKRIQDAEKTRADLLVHSSEKRLALLLLQLAGYGKESAARRSLLATAPLEVSQAALAEIVGTTRSRVSFFMNRFRKNGFIDYNGDIGVHPSLIKVVLQG